MENTDNKAKALEIAMEALDKISSGNGICVSYEYDANPTEKEVAENAMNKIKKLLDEK